MSHLLGTGPKEGDPKFEAWDEEDSMVMSWLWNSMTPEVSDTCMFLSTAKEIWDSIKQTYSKNQDAAIIYEIKTRTAATKQGSKTVTEYANILKNAWQELDHYRCIKMNSSEDAVILKKFIENERVYEFLAGLNTELDQVRVQILGKIELPSLNETISIIRAEESRRGVMLEPQAVEASALMINAAHKATKQEPQQNSEVSKAELSKAPSNENRDAYLNSLWCTHCKKPRHTKEKCWKLHGKPTTSSKEWGYRGGQQRNKGQTHLTTTQQGGERSSEQTNFNKEEIERLRTLLINMETPSIGTCSLAQSGNSPNLHCLNASSRVFSESWVIDSGATDHMTHSSNKFSTYVPCSSNRKIATADGSLTTVAGLGNVQISPSFILKNVLHVPKLSTNLVSINKLTTAMNCRVFFYGTHCVFQD